LGKGRKKILLNLADISYIDSSGVGELVIGCVTDYFGKLIFEARAPVSGVILHINAVPSLKKGDNIANIGLIAAHAP
jgi:hypothetical protein